MLLHVAHSVLVHGNPRYFRVMYLSILQVNLFLNTSLHRGVHPKQVL